MSESDGSSSRFLRPVRLHGDGELVPGAVIDGKYRIDRVLGTGGMGLVFSASDLRLGRRVAIKALSPSLAASKRAVRRFLREARSLSSLVGEHTVRVFEIGELASGAPYIVMELLVGRDLEDLAERRGRLSPREAVDLVIQAIEGVAEAHAAGIIHRDLKPANLFLTQRADGSSLVKVLDFGLAKASAGEETALTAPAAILGTRHYMAPEQLRGAAYVDNRTDVWALGVCLYRLTTGEHPFQPDQARRAKLAPGELVVALSKMILVGNPPAPHALVREIPAGLSRVIMRCLEKDRRRRYADVAELGAALAPFAAQDPVEVGARLKSALSARTRGVEIPSVGRDADYNSASEELSDTMLGPAPVKRRTHTKRARSKRRRNVLVGFALAMLLLLGAEIALLARVLGGTSSAGPLPSASSPADRAR